jgi:hypothetical protein
MKAKTQINDTISYRSFGGEVRTGTVTVSADNVKNDEPGFHMVTTAGEEYWGYDYQLIRLNGRLV